MSATIPPSRPFAPPLTPAAGARLDDAAPATTTFDEILAAAHGASAVGFAATTVFGLGRATSEKENVPAPPCELAPAASSNSSKDAGESAGRLQAAICPITQSPAHARGAAKPDAAGARPPSPPTRHARATAENSAQVTRPLAQERTRSDAQMTAAETRPRLHPARRNAGAVALTISPGEEGLAVYARLGDAEHDPIRLRRQIHTLLSERGLRGVLHINGRRVDGEGKSHG